MSNNGRTDNQTTDEQRSNWNREGKKWKNKTWNYLASIWKKYVVGLVLKNKIGVDCEKMASL
jgi:hypothetical protein